MTFTMVVLKLTTFDGMMPNVNEKQLMHIKHTVAWELGCSQEDVAATRGFMFNLSKG